MTSHSKQILPPRSLIQFAFFSPKNWSFRLLFNCYQLHSSLFFSHPFLLFSRYICFAWLRRFPKRVQYFHTISTKIRSNSFYLIIVASPFFPPFPTNHLSSFTNEITKINRTSGLKTEIYNLRKISSFVFI